MPAATQAPPSSAPSSQPAAPKPGPTAVPVGAMPTPPSVDAAKPADAPAKADNFSGFDKYATSPESNLTLPGSKTQQKSEAPKTPEQPKDEPKADEPTEPVEDADNDDLLGEGKPKTPESKTKVDPVEEKNPGLGKKYRLEVEEHKRTKAERDKLKALIPNPEEATARHEEFERLKTEHKELLDHVRYLDYQKHPEFQEKYQKPYEGKFNQIMNRLRGAKINNEDGTQKPVSTDDILQLGSLNAVDLIDQAEKKFGKLGPWVAERVEELTQLWIDKESAREKAKAEGGKMAAQFESQSKEMNKFLHETYQKSLTDIETHSKYGKFFQQVEGDEDWNSRLENGTKFVDENWQKDPRDPKLSQEDRARIVKAHAAIRNRARAWSVQHLTIQRQEAEIARLSQELKQYTDSTPSIDGQRHEQNGTQPNGKPMDSVFAGIEKYARPGVV